MTKREQEEERIRRLADRSGYRLTKSRSKPDIDNRGEFRLLDERSYVVLGLRFNASLEDIEEFLRRAGVIAPTAFTRAR